MPDTPRITKADLTPEQRRLVDLREDAGLSWPELGREVGLPTQTARSRYLKIRARLMGIRPREHKAKKIDRTVPELVNEEADRRKQQLVKKLMQRLAAEGGISAPLAKRQANRLMRGAVPKPPPDEKMTSKSLLEYVERGLVQLFAYLDDFTISQMSGKDIVSSAGVLGNMRQLLRGEPTSHVRLEDRRKLNELLPALIEEAKRRHLTIDVTPVEEPGD